MQLTGAYEMNSLYCGQEKLHNFLKPNQMVIHYMHQIVTHYVQCLGGGGGGRWVIFW